MFDFIFLSIVFTKGFSIVIDGLVLTTLYDINNLNIPSLMDLLAVVYL